MPIPSNFGLERMKDGSSATAPPVFSIERVVEAAGKGVTWLMSVWPLALARRHSGPFGPRVATIAERLLSSHSPPRKTGELSKCAIFQLFALWVGAPTDGSFVGGFWSQRNRGTMSGTPWRGIIESCPEARLPPIVKRLSPDIALSRCGARVVFHTAVKGVGFPGGKFVNMAWSLLSAASSHAAVISTGMVGRYIVHRWSSPSSILARSIRCIVWY
jgi:hypothetical protein